MSLLTSQKPDASPIKCVTYHHFAPFTSPVLAPLGITTHSDRFCRQLDYLSRHFNVISLSQFLSGDISTNSIIITIDDAYRSVFQIAAPALKERNLPAVMFANPGPIAAQIVPIELVLTFAYGRMGVASAIRIVDPAARHQSHGLLMKQNVAHMSLSELKATKETLLKALGMHELELHQQLDLFLRPEELAALPDFGIEIANHTFSHVHCGPLSRSELETEIVSSRELLRKLAPGQQIQAFAFPWGNHSDATTEALAIARGCGHRAIFLMHGLSNRRRPAEDIWYRILVTNESDDRLRITLGVLPYLRDMKTFIVSTLSGRNP
jgi:peptidoglycan/xylan/chitin deacetylase (PgdA/CDA1 family)